MVTKTNEIQLESFFDRYKLSDEVKKSIKNIFESVSYDILGFLNSNYKEVITDKDNLRDIIEFCFEEMDCIYGGYNVFVFLYTNSVVLQGREECQIYTLEGVKKQIPEGDYLSPKLSIWGCLMPFLEISSSDKPELKEELGDSRHQSKEDYLYGIMSTDGRIIVPAICSQISMDPIEGVSIVINNDIVLLGNLSDKDRANGSIHMPFDESLDLCFASPYFIDQLIFSDDNRTWKKVTSALEKLIDSVPGIELQSLEDVVLNLSSYLARIVYTTGVGIMSQQDKYNFCEELLRILCKVPCKTSTPEITKIAGDESKNEYGSIIVGKFDITQLLGSDSYLSESLTYDGPF